MNIGQRLAGALILLLGSVPLSVSCVDNGPESRTGEGVSERTSGGSEDGLLDVERKLDTIDSQLEDAGDSIDEIDRQSGIKQIDDPSNTERVSVVQEDQVEHDQKNPVAERIDDETGALADSLNHFAEEVEGEVR